jgi:hypothetical protein
MFEAKFSVSCFRPRCKVKFYGGGLMMRFMEKILMYDLMLWFMARIYW